MFKSVWNDIRSLWGASDEALQQQRYAAAYRNMNIPDFAEIERKVDAQIAAAKKFQTDRKKREVAKYEAPPYNPRSEALGTLMEHKGRSWVVVGDENGNQVWSTS